jgi:hypothetical protein
MSENARRKSDGERIKIGTCESMYYLRFDQRGDVDYSWPELSNDPNKLDPFLYRFPDPKEDDVLPGEHESGWGGIKLSIPGYWGTFDQGSVEHGSIQATDTSRRGYLFNLPCPEGNPELYKGPYGKAPQLHRNGGTTTLTIVAQRWYAGHLALVVQCAGCERSIRLQEWKDTRPILEALRALGDGERQQAECYFGIPVGGTEADREQIKENMRNKGAYWDEVASRIASGYGY